MQNALFKIAAKQCLRLLMTLDFLCLILMLNFGHTQDFQLRSDSRVSVVRPSVRPSVQNQASSRVLNIASRLS